MPNIKVAIEGDNLITAEVANIVDLDEVLARVEYAIERLEQGAGYIKELQDKFDPNAESDAEGMNYWVANDARLRAQSALYELGEIRRILTE